MPILRCKRHSGKTERKVGTTASPAAILTDFGIEHLLSSPGSISSRLSPLPVGEPWPRNRTPKKKPAAGRRWQRARFESGAGGGAPRSCRHRIWEEEMADQPMIAIASDIATHKNLLHCKHAPSNHLVTPGGDDLLSADGHQAVLRPAGSEPAGFSTLAHGCSTERGRRRGTRDDRQRRLAPSSDLGPRDGTCSRWATRTLAFSPSHIWTIFRVELACGLQFIESVLIYSSARNIRGGDGFVGSEKSSNGNRQPIPPSRRSLERARRCIAKA